MPNLALKLGVLYRITAPVILLCSVGWKKWQTLFCGEKNVQSSNVQDKTLYFFCHHYKEPSGTYLMNVRSSLKVAMIFVAFFYAPVLVLVAEIHEKYDQRISI